MFRDKGVDRLLRPGGSDAVCQIKGPGDFATKAVDVQLNAVNGWVGQRRLHLRGNPFIRRQAGGLADPSTTVHKCARDFDNGDAFNHGKRLTAIALDIDSFGGEVAGAFDLADRIRAARAQKPVHAFVAEHALSAGYVLASQADRIILPRTGAVGSIGVVALHTDMSGALDQKGIAVTLIHAGSHKIDANPYQPLPEAIHDQMQRELEVVRFLFAETVAAGRGDRLSAAAALATEAAVFRGADAIAAGLADEIADPVTAFHAFAATPRGSNPTSRKGPQMTNTPTDTPNPDSVTAAPAAPVAASAPEPPIAEIAVTPDATAMTAEAIRAEAAEVAQVCAQAARLGVTIDAADAVTRGIKPEALRARVLADLAARSDAAGIVATAPAAAAAKDSPIIAAAKKAATDAKH
jgi:ClpP class serine protease